MKHEANPNTKIEYTTTEGYLRFIHFSSTYNGGPPNNGYRPILIDNVQIIRNQALTELQIKDTNNNPSSITWQQTRQFYNFIILDNKSEKN